MTNTSSLSPAMAAFRTWQATEPREVVEAIPVELVFEEFKQATADDNHATPGILVAQALSLHVLCTRLFEFAADAHGDWPKYSALIDFALRAQEQSRKAFELALTQTGDIANGHR